MAKDVRNRITDLSRMPDAENAGPPNGEKAAGLMDRLNTFLKEVEETQDLDERAQKLNDAVKDDGVLKSLLDEVEASIGH